MAVNYKVLNDDAGRSIGSNIEFKTDGTFGGKTTAELRVRLPEDKYEPPKVIIDLKDKKAGYDTFKEEKFMQAAGVERDTTPTVATSLTLAITGKDKSKEKLHNVAGNITVAMALKDVITAQDAATTLGKLDVSKEADVCQVFDHMPGVSADTKRKVFAALNKEGYGQELFGKNVQLVVHDLGGRYERPIGVKFGSLAAAYPVTIKETALKGSSRLEVVGPESDYERIEHFLEQVGVAFRRANDKTTNPAHSGGLYIEGSVAEVVEKLGEVGFFTRDLSAVAASAAREAIGDKAKTLEDKRKQAKDDPKLLGA